MTLRVLIDENLPVGIHRWFPQGTAETVKRNARKEMKNGALLRKAVAAGFTVLLTADRAMYREHDFSTFQLGLVVVPTNRWRALQAMRSAIVAAVVAAKPGDDVELPWSPDPSEPPV